VPILPALAVIRGLLDRNETMRGAINCAGLLKPITPSRRQPTPAFVLLVNTLRDRKNAASAQDF